ncbi:MAG: FGGY-family carbohydrate kinase [Granulosicoccus sp.]
MPKYVAVIDLGKTNSKVALVNTKLAQEVLVTTQANIVNSASEYPCLDHQAIKAFVLDSLKMLANEHEFEAITVTTHGATVALLDKDGDLALPVLDYEYEGVDALRAEYERYRAPFASTGSPALPGGLNVGAQLHWLEKNYPEKFASVTSILTWPQYWIYILSGEQNNDVTSLGCHTDLYDPDRADYSSLVDAMQWRHLLAPACKPGQLSGTLLKSLTDQLGLPRSIPVFSGIHDSNASLVPHLLTNTAPFSVVSTGTWFISMAIGGKETQLDESRDTLINVNALGQSVPSARFMGGRERELLKVTGKANEKALQQLLDDANPEPAMVMPSAVRGTGPYPTSQLQWIGRAIDNPELRNCAVTLYLALMTHECLLLIGSRGATYVEGPLAHDSLYGQMLCAVSNRQVLISDAQTGTSVGAAMLITPPETLPEYQQVTIDQTRRNQLRLYAERWKKQLQIHAK